MQRLFFFEHFKKIVSILFGIVREAFLNIFF